MSESLYADIIVNISVESLDKSYQYKIPKEWENSVTIGTQVMIPFGAGDRQIKGYVVGLSNTPKIDVSRIKCISGLVNKGITATEQLLMLAGWMRKRYGSTMNEAIKTVLPVKKKIKELEKKRIILDVSIEEANANADEFDRIRKNSPRARLIRELINVEFLDYDYVRNVLNISTQIIKGLQEKNLIRIESERVYRNPVKLENTSDKCIVLNEEQRGAVTGIVDRYRKGDSSTCLLHGVTGSGKTEVYMAVMEEVIKDGKQVIMLIPEIALTYQTVRRFYARFGNRVSVLNSRMSAGERYDQYERALNGEIDIIIGPRSALFMPFERLGLIVMDEEHEDSYKSEMPPKYHAREVARQRANMSGAMLLLGSATPSVETYYRSTDNYVGDDRIERFELTKRTGNATLPEVSIVDMREEFKAKNYSMLSRELHEKLSRCLERNEQAILFLNRRGHTGFCSCRSCGEVVKCPHCDVSLTIHNVYGSSSQKMVCHYCGYESQVVTNCKKCGSKYIGGFSVGTQKVEEMLQNVFPQARVLRMDADTTTGKSGHENVLKAFAEHKADILVGTQMIVKGHDFPLVTLVGILAADLSLHVSDYRSAEKTYQLLVQAEGRAGRAERPGNVVIQTYQPEHYAVVSAAGQDYVDYYNREIMYRKVMKYPPVSYIMTVFASSSSEAVTEQVINEANRLASVELTAEKKAIIIGPAPHPVYKANDMYRYVMYIKCADVGVLENVRETIENGVQLKLQGVKYTIQFDME